MNTETIKSEPKIELDSAYQVKEEKQIMVRSWYPFGTGLRIWSTTYLICNQTGKRAKLLYTENVGKYPHWKWLNANERFLMVFEALPDECVSFDLFEDIPEPGEFHTKGIRRNKLGVYDVPMV